MKTHKAPTPFWPKISGSPAEITFLIDAHQITLQDASDYKHDSVILYVDGEISKTFVSGEYAINEVLDLFGHRVFIKFTGSSKDSIWELFRKALLVDEGLYVAIDGRPLEGTLADPRIKIKNISSGYYILGGLALLAAGYNHDLLFFYIPLACVAFLAAKLSSKAPVAFSLIGIIWGVSNILGLIDSIYNNPPVIEKTTQSLYYGLFAFLHIGIVFLFTKGIIGVIGNNYFSRGGRIKLPESASPRIESTDELPAEKAFATPAKSALIVIAILVMFFMLLTFLSRLQ